MGEYTVNDPDLIKTTVVQPHGQVYLGDFKGDKVRITVERIESGVLETDGAGDDVEVVDEAEEIDPQAVDDAELDVNTECNGNPDEDDSEVSESD